MRIRCEQCGLDMEVAPDSVGKKLKCPECMLVFVCQVPRAIVVDEQGQDGDLVVLDELIEEPAGPTASADEALARMSRAAPKQVLRESPRQWHIIIGGVPAVALTYRELVQRAAEGEVKPKTRIYYAPKNLTMPARDIPGLFADIDAKRRQAGKPKPVRPLTQAEKAEAAALAEALGAVGEADSGPPRAPADEPAQAPAAESPEAAALADALDTLGDQGKQNRLAAEPRRNSKDTSPEVQALAEALEETEGKTD